MSIAAPDLLSLVRHAGSRFGATPCIAVADEVLPFATLQQRVERTAAGLLANGLRPGDRVVVLLHRCVDEAVAILATAAAGGIAVPVHGKLKDAQVAHVLADCDPFAVVTSSLRLLALRDPANVLRDRRRFRVGATPLPSAAESWTTVDADASGLRPPPGRTRRSRTADPVADARGVLPPRDRGQRPGRRTVGRRRRCRVNGAWVTFKKELFSYLVGPVGWLVAAVFYVWRGYEFCAKTVELNNLKYDRDLISTASYGLSSTFWMMILVPGVLPMPIEATGERSGEPVPATGDRDR